MTDSPLFLDARTVRQSLDMETCIRLMREVMPGLSSAEEGELLRSFIALGEGQTFALMPGALTGEQGFGAKLVSVYAHADHKAHEGLVILFDRVSGKPVCVADASEITRIRTAAMSAAATDVLARKDASRLALIGTGLQARAHIDALARVRTLDAVTVWGRDPAKTDGLAADLREAGYPVRACASVRDAVEAADIICTVTASREPVLPGAWVRPGTHVNLVGSSGPMAAETDTDLLVKARVFPDHRPHVEAHGGELLRAIESGRYSADRLEAEIGAVMAGEAPGRQSATDITVFKSLGHAVQDLSAVAWLYQSLRRPQ
ncbi:ornithine cyclodeaminase family protein [Maricaulis parjimensis]|uniref:ornithine cyclodeaminase family protein n=1 Tax=Maricaulis parjimensis TaxID=144023 RepID=UPI00193A4AFD|nr:hypothetical protein [Maricaulis parjimensis]